MANKQSLRTKIVLEYLDRFPKSSKRTLAEKIYKENKLLFESQEDARFLIRRLTGATGESELKLKKVDHTTNFTGSNPYGLPETEAKPFEPYILPKANNNILFLSDIHLPYHDIHALTLALNYGKEKGVNTIYLNGDIMDCHKASFHEQDPKKRDMGYEFDVCRQFLDLLKKEFPKAKIFFKQGNHECFIRKNVPLK